MSDIGQDPVTVTALANLPTNIFQRYSALYTFWSTVSTNLQAQLLKRSLDQPINAYSFDAGEGRQSTQRMTLEELQKAVINADNMALFYYRRMYGRGLMHINLRRR